MDDVIKKLKALDDRYPWCNDFENIEIIVISAEGVYENYSEHADPINGPYVLSDDDHNSLTNVSDESDLEDTDFDPEEAPEMFNVGCEPGLSYFKWSESLPGDADFHEWDEIFAEFEASGLSVGAFCRRKKLPKSTFSKRRVARERKPATRRVKPARFVELTPDPSTPSSALTPVVGTHAFELLLPGGAVLRWKS